MEYQAPFFPLWTLRGIALEKWIALVLNRVSRAESVRDAICLSSSRRFNDCGKVLLPLRAGHLHDLVCRLEGLAEWRPRRRLHVKDSFNDPSNLLNIHKSHLHYPS